jgi:hypothetical protein
VTGHLDHQTDIVRRSEVHTGLDVRDLCGLDYVLGIGVQSAKLRVCLCRRKRGTGEGDGGEQVSQRIRSHIGLVVRIVDCRLAFSVVEEPGVAYLADGVRCAESTPDGIIERVKCRS